MKSCDAKRRRQRCRERWKTTIGLISKRELGTLNNRFWTVLRFYLICFWLYGMSTTWWKNVKRLVISHHLSCTALPRGLSYYRVSLHTGRMELCSKLFTKIKEPESRLRHLVPPTRSQAHGRSLRNKDRPSLIRCKTERFKRSFFRRCAFMLMACNV